MIALAVVPVVLATLLIGARGVAAMRTTSDFLVASRRISPAFNAAAVSGEYLSAASFLGIAGLVVKGGVGALWYPVGFTAGYLLDADPRRRPAAADLRAHRPRLRRGPARVAGAAASLRGGRARDRLPVPRPAVHSRGTGADAGQRGAVLGRGRRRGRRGQRDAGPGRHARRDLRPGLPVPAQAAAVHRPGDLAAGQRRPAGARPGAAPGRVHPLRAAHPRRLLPRHPPGDHRDGRGADRRPPGRAAGARSAHRAGRGTLGVPRRGRGAADRRRGGAGQPGVAAPAARRRPRPATRCSAPGRC